MMRAARTVSRLMLVAVLAACADGGVADPEIPAPGITPGFNYGQGNGNQGNGNHGDGNPGHGNPGHGNHGNANQGNGQQANRPNRKNLQVLAKYRRSNRDPESVKRIGPAGGTVRAGDYQIIVPPGAVDRSSVFHIKLPNGGGRGGRVYAEFTSSRPFTKPVTIILPQDITNASPSSSILWWNDGSLEWEVMPTVPTGDGRLQTTTTHFSIYGVSRGRGWIDLGG